MDYEFQIFTGTDGQIYSRIVHANGQTIFVSEGYTRRQSAIDSLTNFVAAMAMFFQMNGTIYGKLLETCLKIEADCE